ncbi:MAG: RNA-binding transcriptional accessory protein [Planctomycetes bacterium]|nr:RNA-binding transcriptional accessory protein [Planctomycetota bacterium]
MPVPTTFDPVPAVSHELELSPSAVAAVVRLLDEGNTVPFIARYRKEATGGLDEVQIRAVADRAGYVRELEERRRTVIDSIEGQGKLTDDLRRRLEACATKTELEDLYLPYRPKRRTRATLARERGLEPLAELLRRSPSEGTPEEAARPYIDPDREVPDIEAALAGARDIVAEMIAESAEVRAHVREVLARRGVLTARVVRGKKDEGAKYAQYFDYREPVPRVAPHRYLAMRRGEREGVLRVRIEVEPADLALDVADRIGYRRGTAYSGQMREAIEDSVERLLLPSLDTEVRTELGEEADRSAVDTFASNLEDLLLAPPFGDRRIVAIDPGIRTGCKCVGLDETGRLLRYETIFPLTNGSRDRDRAIETLRDLVRDVRPDAIAIGNGTGGRETEAFVRELLREHGPRDLAVVSVSEAGASVYSASDVAREEFPDLDLTIRGAISIGRRLQDPLAELVKIDPRSIGVGQYQHDVRESLLEKKLDEVVESCVHRVGVELNSASAPLLAHVSGIGPGLAKKIVAHREAIGRFEGRDQLMKVSGLGAKTFEQAAGFLRIRGGRHPLDASAVHPERYRLVESIARDLGVDVAALIGDERATERIDVNRYVGSQVGELTLRDIVAELKKPGRDPRADFERPTFREDVQSPADLEVGMRLEGIVTNVTDFGAFVDIGVHQDGLVHISELSDRFVSDPHQVVRVGQRIRVRVLSVDRERNRIGLSAKS